MTRSIPVFAMSILLSCFAQAAYAQAPYPPVSAYPAAPGGYPPPPGAYPVVPHNYPGAGYPGTPMYPGQPNFQGCPNGSCEEESEGCLSRLWSKLFPPRQPQDFCNPYGLHPHLRWLFRFQSPQRYTSVPNNAPSGGTLVFPNHPFARSPRDFFMVGH